LSKTKSYSISKHVVWKAYELVKANKGSAGIDDETIADFEKRLKDNLYKIWNRMSSGSYFPPAVKRVEIDKADGKKRPLGIPTVSDRIAQTVVKLYLESEIEPYFHKDSYGYRPKKSALEAVGMARKRCWNYDWVIDLDIKAFFDNLNHELMMRAVRKHTESKWILLYIERWLKAPFQMEDGKIEKRDKGTPQGGVISPLLANLFLHYAFDEWMKREYPSVLFERYADDVIVHCMTVKQARYIKSAIEKRLAQCELEVHPEKTKIVYCKDDNRGEDWSDDRFDFLGYTFMARIAKSRYGKYFMNFLPAMSNKAVKWIGRKMRKWKLHLWSCRSIEELASMFNPVIRGWINYYGKFYKTKLYPVFKQLNMILIRWAMRKYKKLRRHQKRASHWLRRISKRDCVLFVHWDFGVRP